MKKIVAVTIMAFGLMLGACSEKPAPAPEQPKMSDEQKKSMFQQVEQALERTRANAVTTATMYKMENPRLQGTKIVAHADSTVSAECLSGDGWASVSFIGAKPEDIKAQPEKYKAVCSTVSEARGCWLREDFEKKPFSMQEGRCDRSLPTPLPVIGKQ